MSLHYLERDEVNGLKLLRRQQQAKKGRTYSSMSVRQPFGRMGPLPHLPAWFGQGSEWSQIDLDAAMLHVRGVARADLFPSWRPGISPIRRS
jgi:hypothetical protein